MEFYIIKKIKISNDYVLVYFDDEKIMVTIDDYYEYKLKEGITIDSELYNTLLHHETVFKSYRSCLKKISIKDYSIKQIRQSLNNKKLDKKDIDDIIDKLISYGLLDDDKYCEAKSSYYDKSLLSYKNIRQKLLNDGIDNNIIEKYVIYDENREIEKAELLSNKYIKSINNKSKKSLKQALLYKLNSQGYTYDISKQVIDNLDIEVKNELELLSKEYFKSYKKYSKKYEDYELKSKIYNSLLLKGFNSQDIRKVMEEEYGQES